MSIQKNIFLCTGFCSIIFLTTSFSTVFAETFSRNLTIGDLGSDVLQLQVFLNQNPATKIAGTGAGSPGKETTYYGALTADAVRRYQELHPREILIPHGLNAGTGFFGAGTRALVGLTVGLGQRTTPVSSLSRRTTQNSEDVASTSVFSGSMNSVVTDAEVDPDKEEKEIFASIMAKSKPSLISQKQIDEAKKDTNVIPATKSTPPTTRAILDIEQKQNEENVEMLITLLEEGGYLKDMKPEVQDAVKKQIRENTKKGLVSQIKSSDNISWRIPQAQKSETLLAGFGKSIISMFQPKQAEAFAIPIFGGYVYYRFLCTASGTWAILVGLPMPAWLGYTYAQGYAYWQMPFALITAGWYTPGVQSCYFYVGTGAVLIPTMGVMTFFMGSSLP
jgi:hypothetical protein